MRHVLARRAVAFQLAMVGVVPVLLLSALVLLHATGLVHFHTEKLLAVGRTSSRAGLPPDSERRSLPKGWYAKPPYATYLAVHQVPKPVARVGRAADPPLGVMPPHPDLLKRLEAEKRPLPDFIRDPVLWKRKGLGQSPHPVSNPSGTFNAIALLVQFDGNLAQVNASSFDTLLFGPGPGTLTDYYEEVSYGTLTIVTLDLPSIKGWYLAPEPYGYYVDGQYGIDGTYPNNARKLAEDVVLLADPIVDFSRYDNDGDGWVDTVFIVHTGPGAEFTGNANDIWSHSWTTVNDPVVDGVRVDSYTIEPEYWLQPGDMTIGVFAHELGHAFGLPDLYDRDRSSSGIGYWGLMGSGSWNGPYNSRGSSPAHFTAWSRMQLGFLTPTVVSGNLSGTNIPAIEASPTAYVLWDGGASGNEYFIVENRQPFGYDASLPGHGLLIWHIDDDKNTYSDQNDNECLSLNNCDCATGHYLMALEQADGLLDLEKRTNRGDTGDPYPGSMDNRAFTFVSSPNSSGYNSCTTQVQVVNISDSATTMTADLKIAVPYAVGLDPSSQSRRTRPNTVVDYLQQVRNLGASADSFGLEATTDLWPTTIWDASFSTIISDTGTLVPGQMVTVGIRVEISAEVVPGQSGKAVLRATSTGDPSVFDTAAFLTSVANPVLLVDDDQSSTGDVTSPDVASFYEASLTNAGQDYDVWDTRIKGSPDAGDLAVYDVVVWFTGQPWSDTLSEADEAALAIYLDQGGRLFLSSQEYLYDRGLTDFGRNYLHIGRYTDDQKAATVLGVDGNPVGGGLGLYTLSYLYTDYSDEVFPDDAARPAFLNDRGNPSAITYEGGNFRTVFFAFPFDALPAAGATAVMHRVLDWLTATATGAPCSAYYDEDVNRNGVVDVADVGQVASAWRAYDERYDLDDDGDVDIVDAMRVAGHLGDGCM